MKRATKYHGVMATLKGETDMAVNMDATHIDYGSCPGLWVPKSCIHEESLELIDAATEGDTLEVYIAGWWWRKNFGEVG